MKNIIRIAKNDILRIANNTISILLIIGMICVTGVYAWFNIVGNWDPYSDNSRIPIAIVNDDQGYSSKYLPIKVSIGDEIVAKLYKDKEYKWTSLDYDSAMNALDNREVFSVLVLPSDLTNNYIKQLTDDSITPTITYYNDEKQNPVVPKLMSQNIDFIKFEINKMLSEDILKSIFNTTSSGIDSLKKLDDEGDSENSLLGELRQTISLLNATSSQLSNLKSISGDINNWFNDVKSLKEDLNKDAATVKKTIEESIIPELDKRAQDYKFSIERLKELGLESEIGPLEKLLNANEQIKSLVNQLSTNPQLDVDFDKATSMLSSLNSSIDEAINLINSVKSDLDWINTLFIDLASSQKVNDIDTMLTDISSLSKLLASPVEEQREAVYSIENNGSSVAAFYTSLSLWVGSIICALFVKVSPSTISVGSKRKSKGKTVNKPPTRVEMFFGRYIIFAIIALIQATVISLGNIFFIRIQCYYPLLFILSSWVFALLFSFFVYVLAVSFGNIGKALAVILLILQIACAGGMFPEQMIEWPFNLIFPYLPITYSIKIFRYCVAGFEIIELLWSFALITLLLLPISLFLAFVVHKPVWKLNNFVDGKLKESDVILQ